MWRRILAGKASPTGPWLPPLATSIENFMKDRLQNRGVTVTEFFVRDINPPDRIKQAIENKLAQEQKVQEETYRTQVVREQANQRREEARGIRDAQQIIAESLTDEYIRYEVVKALQAAADGQNNTILGVPDANVLLGPGR